MLIKKIIKLLLLQTHPLAKSLANKKSKNEPYFCIITPVFDPALPAIKKLIKDLKDQTFNKFIHILISNNTSPKVKKYIRAINKTDKRFIYDQINEKISNDPVQIYLNLGKRREYALKKYNAKRYHFFDADLNIKDRHYFAKLFMMQQFFPKKEVFVHNSLSNGYILPFKTFAPASLDISNYSISNKIAKKFKYPSDHQVRLGLCSDLRFFKKINTKNNTMFLDYTPAIRNGHKYYKSLSESLEEKDKNAY